jgi:hypothetical protein
MKSSSVLSLLLLSILFDVFLFLSTVEDFFWEFVPVFLVHLRCEDVKKKTTPKKINSSSSSDGTNDGFMIEKGVKKKYTSKRICSSSDSTGDVLLSAKEVKKRHMPKKIYISSSDNTDDDFMTIVFNKFMV